MVVIARPLARRSDFLRSGWLSTRSAKSCRAIAVLAFPMAPGRVTRRPLVGSARVGRGFMRRHATLASVSKRPAGGIGSEDETRLLLDDATALIRRAARMGADIVAFPEVYPQLALHDLMDREEPEEEGTLEPVRELAREHGMYVVWPRYERAGDGHKYNAA